MMLLRGTVNAIATPGCFQKQ